VAESEVTFEVAISAVETEIGLEMRRSAVIEVAG
jgi:hypothetical protein